MNKNKNYITLLICLLTLTGVFLSHSTSERFEKKNTVNNFEVQSIIGENNEAKENTNTNKDKKQTKKALYIYPKNKDKNTRGSKPKDLSRIYNNLVNTLKRSNNINQFKLLSKINMIQGDVSNEINEREIKKIIKETVDLDDYEVVIENDPILEFDFNDQYYPQQEQGYLSQIGRHENIYQECEQNSINNTTIAIIEGGFTGDYPLDDIPNNITHIDINQGPENHSTHHGHGVLSVIASKVNNVIGISGIRLFSHNFLTINIEDSEGIMTMSDMLLGLNAAIESGADIVNISASAKHLCTASIQNAFNQAANQGTIIVGSAGNDNSDEMHIPAGCNNVIGVASVNSNSEKSSSSNYGSWVDISAPGEDIYIANAPDPTNSIQTNRKQASGTSYSAPIVSAAISIAISQGKNVNDVLQNTKPVNGSGLGNGVVSFEGLCD